MANKITLEVLPQVPSIKEGDDVGKVIVDVAEAMGVSFIALDIDSIWAIMCMYIKCFSIEYCQ
jgi:hypothetical protein